MHHAREGVLLARYYYCIYYYRITTVFTTRLQWRQSTSREKVFQHVHPVALLQLCCSSVAARKICFCTAIQHSSSTYAYLHIDTYASPTYVHPVALLQLCCSSVAVAAVAAALVHIDTCASLQHSSPVAALLQLCCSCCSSNRATASLQRWYI